MNETTTNQTPETEGDATMDLRSIRYGIEIETLGITRHAAANAIQSVVGGRAEYAGGAYDAWQVTDIRNRVWKVVTDASINAPRDLQGEVVSPVLNYEDLEQLQAVVRAIREAGARVDASCGIHVHCDASALDGRGLANLAKMVYKQEPLIFHALGVSAGRQARYTRPVDDDAGVRRAGRLPARCLPPALRMLVRPPAPEKGGAPPAPCKPGGPPCARLVLCRENQLGPITSACEPRCELP